MKSESRTKTDVLIANIGQEQILDCRNSVLMIAEDAPTSEGISNASGRYHIVPVYSYEGFNERPLSNSSFIGETIADIARMLSQEQYLIINDIYILSRIRQSLPHVLREKSGRNITMSTEDTKRVIDVLFPPQPISKFSLRKKYVCWLC